MKKLKISIRTILLCTILLVSHIVVPGMTLPAQAAAAAPDAGDGSAANPYIINESSDLVWMQENYSSIKSKHFRQTCDIDMTGVTFIPIGNGTSNTSGDYFTGLYDGMQYKISNLTINSSLQSIGLFQRVYGGPGVKNVNLVNAAIANNVNSGSEYIGGIAGEVGNAPITRCAVSGSITFNVSYDFNTHAGGIAGSSGGSILDCYSTATVTNHNVSGSYLQFAGGITGGNNGDISRCYFAGSLAGNSILGAITGLSWDGTSTASNNVFLTGTATYAQGWRMHNNGATSASAEQMKVGSTYAGWDFTEVWVIDEGLSYPGLMTAPSKPTGLTTEAHDGLVNLTWNTAERAKEYLLYIGTEPGVYGEPESISATSKTVTGLTNFTNYYFAVRAVRDGEQGALSDEASAQPHAEILNLAATPASSRVDLSFSAPTGATSVKLQLSTGGGGFVDLPGVALNAASTSAAVTGLTNAVLYSFRLRITYPTGTFYSNTATMKAGTTENELSGLTASGCSFAFDPTGTAYSANVPDSQTSADITATLLNPLASITINGSAQANGIPVTVSLVYGANSFDITVTAENGDTKAYSLTLTRVLPGYVIKRTPVHGKDTQGMFNPYRAGYWWSSDQKNFAFRFDLSADTNRVLEQALLYLYVDRNYCNGTLGTFDIFGSNDDNWSTSLPATRDSTPILSGVTGLPTGWYTVDVTDYIRDHRLNMDQLITFFFAGANPVSGSHDIAVHSQNSLFNKPYLALFYTNNDATLSAITVGGATLPGFVRTTTAYTYDVPHGTDPALLVFASTVYNAAATQGAWSYSEAEKQWSVTVTAEDGLAQNTYSVTVNVLPSTDATLKSIQIGGVGLAGFTPGTLNYTYDVVHGTGLAALAFTSEANDHMATQDSWAYDPDLREWSVTVTAEDGVTTKTYTVTVHELPSTDASLKIIKIGGVGLNGFDPDILNYTLNVAHGTDITALAITGEANDHMATLGGWAYDPEQHKWSVTVTAEDDAITRTYTVTANELPSTDASLKNIKVGGVNFNGFKSDTPDYTLNVVHGTEIAALVFTSEVSDHMATQSPWVYDPDLRRWSVTVTAEDGVTINTYVVTVNELTSTDANLSVIRVGGAAIAGFSQTKLDYTLNVAHGVNPAGLSITSQTNDHMAVQGAWTYNPSGRKWSVTITAENGITTKTYTVTIHVLPSTNATLAYIWLDGDDLEGFSPLITNYTITLPYDTDIALLNFVSEPADDMATMGGWFYDADTSKWSVTVTAENGVSTRTYTIKVLLLEPASSSAASTTEPPPSTLASASPVATTAVGTPSPAPEATPSPTDKQELVPDGALKVTFAVTDGTSPISGAAFELDGVLKKTDSNGHIVFMLSSGSYTYRVDSVGYESTAGTVNVHMVDTVICILLAKQGTVVLHSDGDDEARLGRALVIADESSLPPHGTLLLVVEKIAPTQQDANAVQKQAGAQYRIEVLYDIYLLADAKKKQPNAPVRVGLPIPQNLISRNLQVVRIDDGTVTPLETVQAGDMLFFTTDHFSKYAIVLEDDKKLILPLWFIVVLCLMILLLLLFILQRMRRLKRNHKRE